MKDKAKQPRVKLIALDLDGTTLNSRGILTEGTKDAIHRAVMQKVHVVVATGRAYSAIPREILEMSEIQYVVTSNGARVIDLRTKESIYTNLIHETAIENAVEVLRKHDFMMEAFISGAAYVDRKTYDNIEHVGLNRKHTEYVLKTREPVDDLLGFMIHHKANVENININFARQEDKNMMAEILAELENVTITSSFDHNLEIGGATTSKADALGDLCLRLKIQAFEMMACGDSPNDLSMLLSSGFPVAMGNGKDQVKAIARFITGSNDEDGVATAIRKFVLP